MYHTLGLGSYYIGLGLVSFYQKKAAFRTPHACTTHTRNENNCLERPVSTRKREYGRYIIKWTGLVLEKEREFSR